MRRLFLVAAALGLALAPAASLAAEMQAFKAGGQTVLVSATTTATTVALKGAGGTLLIVSQCTVPVRVDATGATATTPAVGMPGSLGVPASSTMMTEVGSLVTTVSVKVDSGSACNVELTRGEGLTH